MRKLKVISRLKAVAGIVLLFLNIALAVLEIVSRLSG